MPSTDGDNETGKRRLRGVGGRFSGSKENVLKLTVNIVKTTELHTFDGKVHGISRKSKKILSSAQLYLKDQYM